MTVEAGGRPRPRLGLALSGGGFRAAFFHIGVLARMAEMGMLRRVEVISTVSGGSIVGALYYIHVRALLQAIPDDEITDGHYADIVERIAETFLRGVETNLRGRTFRDLRKNVRMARNDYSRSDRLGELYDETFYRPAWNERRDEMIEMRELLIVPAGEGRDFNPVKGNPGRNAPVPILMINATSLNTGHNWRFEAVGMGEPDRAGAVPEEQAAREDPLEDARREVDRNERLRWTRYDLLPKNQANFELGYAVAASACVPTLFHPLPVTRLFQAPDRKPITVQLVDGGVHDNQGIEGLIEYDCDPIVVSDASGYLPDDRDPATRIPAVAGRTLGIYGDRVREEQLINARLDRDETRFGLMHLRKGIAGFALSPTWEDAGSTPPPRREPPTDFRGERFQVDQEIQRSLSRVRTDLDAFSQVEAYSLMLDGYRMTGPNLARLEVDGTAEPLEPRRWAFNAVAAAAESGAPELYRRHLSRAKSRFWKAIFLSGRGKLLAAAFLLLGVAALVLLLLIDAVRAFLAAPMPVWALFAFVAGVLVLGFLYMNARLPKLIRWFADRLYTQAVPALLAIPLWLGAFVVLAFSRIFVAAGRVEGVLPNRPSGRGPST
ncbi:MAG: patatin-like phospholipase family protein [Gaiellaceae bacterium]